MDYTNKRKNGIYKFSTKNYSRNVHSNKQVLNWQLNLKKYTKPPLSHVLDVRNYLNSKEDNSLVFIIKIKK